MDTRTPERKRFERQAYLIVFLTWLGGMVVSLSLLYLIFGVMLR